MKIFKILGNVMIAISMIVGLFLYIVSFVLWADWIGFWGYVVAFFYAPDIVLIIKRIIDYGFSDWFFLAHVAAYVVFFLGSSIKSKKSND